MINGSNIRPGDNELVKALNESAVKLLDRIEAHHNLIKSVMEERFGGFIPLQGLGQGSQSNREIKLKEAVAETIRVLEESRKAFKSKHLESLRKKLIQTLIDLN